MSELVTSAGDEPAEQLLGEVDGVPDSVRHAVGVFFGERERAATVTRFVGHLASSGVERGLIGPREVPRLWERHVLNCAAVAPLLPADCSVMDVGSGAGLPGLVLAIARPDVRVTLVEPLQRRATWLTEVADDLGLGNVTVHRGRAEEVRGLGLFDVVTARAVASLDVLAGWCLPHVRPGGELIALKGQSAGEELSASVGRLSRLGAVSWAVEQCGDPVLAEPTTVVRIVVGAVGRGGPAQMKGGSPSGRRRGRRGGARGTGEPGAPGLRTQ